jgi:hypothetical protein
MHLHLFQSMVVQITSLIEHEDEIIPVVIMNVNEFFHVDVATCIDTNSYWSYGSEDLDTRI